MDTPQNSPPSRRFTRRTLFRFAGAGVLLGLTAETVRVFGLTNKHTVIPGRVYRTAQLGPGDLAREIASKKIRTVINLRGTCPDTNWYMDESRTTHSAEICQEDIALSAKRLPAPNEIRRLIDVLDHTEYPVMIHCQRGADRTGLVATAAVLLQTNSTLSEARRQLWPRYGHIRGGRTGVIDQFFDYYQAWLASKGKAHTPELFRHWAEHEYCPGPYRAELSLVESIPKVLRVESGFSLKIRAVNTSGESWKFRPGAAGGIQLRYTLFDLDGAKLFVNHAGLFDKVIPPGGHIDLVAGFPPIAKAGIYLVHTDLLDTQPIELLDADFVQYGSDPLVFEINVQ